MMHIQKDDTESTTENEKKDFWVRHFYGEEGFYTYFNNADEILPNIPYIITVPDNINEDGYTLVGKPLVFSASNARVLSGKVVADAHNYNFEGSYYEKDIEGTYVYKLDEEANGNNFVYMEDGATIEPFRGYFTSEAAPVEHNVLYVVSYIDVPTITGVKDLPVEPKANDGDMASTHDNIFRVYAITGTLVKTEKGKSLTEVLQSLPKGIYIINGKKYMR